MSIIIDTDHKVTNEALDIWGEKSQIAILQEECGELICALARYNRGRTDKEPVAEECADVIVSMMSCIPALDMEYLVKHYIKHKISRLDGRTRLAKIHK